MNTIKSGKFRDFLFRDDNGNSVEGTIIYDPINEDKNNLEKASNFIKWTSDWYCGATENE